MTRLVSVGMPVFNGERHLPAALAALSAQDYPDLEIVISDNASTDRTEEICRAAAGRDRRIRYHRLPSNRGPMANFHNVFDLARGDYFAWAGDHDLWSPRFVSACATALDANPEAVLAYPLMRYIDADGNLVEGRDQAIDTTGVKTIDRVVRLFERYPVCAVYGLIRVDALRAVTTEHGVGLHRPLDHAYPDVVLLLKLGLLGGYALVPETLYYNRVLHRRRMTTQEQVERLAPGRGIHGRWSRLNLFRDLAAAIWGAQLDLDEKVLLSILLARYWGWEYSRTYLYEIDKLRILTRTKRAAQAILRLGRD